MVVPEYAQANKNRLIIIYVVCPGSIVLSAYPVFHDRIVNRGTRVPVLIEVENNDGWLTDKGLQAVSLR